MEWLENPDYAELGPGLNRGTPTGYRQVVSKVILRAESEGSDQRHLWAHSIKKQYIPQFLELLNQDPGANVMTVLQGYAGERCDLVSDAITAAADKFPIEFWSRF